MPDVVTCDVGVCRTPAELMVTFYGQTREWAYCSGHSIKRDGSFVWKGKVQSVRTIEQVRR